MEGNAERNGTERREGTQASVSEYGRMKIQMFCLSHGREMEMVSEGVRIQPRMGILLKSRQLYRSICPF